MAKLALVEADEIEEEPEATIQVVMAPPLIVENVWPDIERYVEQACDASHGDMTPDVAKQRCLGKHSQLWIVVRDGKPAGFAMSRIDEWEARRALIYWLGAGDDGESWLLTMVETAEAFAKQAGCSCVDLEGRWGWQKWLKPHGYERIRAYFRKEIEK